MEEEEDGEKLESFLQWASAVGISDCSISGDNFSRCLGHSLAVSNFPDAGGRGLAATRVLRKGELILRVPKAALMTSDALISKDQKLAAALEKHPSLSPTQSFQILGVCLLNEMNKGRSSWWYPYLKQLPKSYGLLETFSPSEIEALQIDHAIQTAERAVMRSKVDWEAATPLMSELRLKPRFLTFKAWLWSSSTISSRTMHIPWDVVAGCLCPVGDFFNYTPPEAFLNPSNDSEVSEAEFSCRLEMNINVERLTDAGYEENTLSYCFYANRNYAKGDQVLLCYGAYTNLELLEYYGFILQDNSNDKAYIPLEPDILALCPWPGESLYISQNGEPSFALLSTLRLWTTPVSDRRSIKHLVNSGDPISDENETAVFEMIIQKCQEVLRSCPTSIDEDELLLLEIHEFENCSRDWENFQEQLKDDGYRKSSSHMWKLAVQWRQKYKKILHDCITKTETGCFKL